MIEQLTVNVWIGRGVTREEIARPSWDQVEAAIRALNERERNDIYLTPSACDLETYLSVGGGDGRYLVTGSINNERFPTVATGPRLGSAREATEELVSGGQMGDYPCRWILDLATALRAIRSFYDTSEFGGSDVIWEGM